MDIEALATLLTIEKNNLDIHCNTSKKNNSCDVCYCLCCFWSMLVQDLEGVRSSLSNFFRTISPKPRSNHQRSIWIILPQSLKKKHNFLYNFQLKYFKWRPHLFKRIMLWKEVAKKQKCAPVQEMEEDINQHCIVQNLNNVAANLLENCDGKTTHWTNLPENWTQW